MSRRVQAERRGSDWFGWAIVALAALLYFAVAATAIVDYLSRRNTAMDDAAQRADRMNYVLAEHLRSTVASIDAALKQLAVHSRQVGGPQAGEPAWSAALASTLAGLPGVASLAVASADGVIRHATSPDLLGQVRADRPVFRALRDPVPQDFAADALERAPSGRLVIPLGHRLESAQGGFDGMIVATLDLELLRGIYRAADAGPHGLVAVVHPGGDVLLRQPPGEDGELPERLASGALRRALMRGGHNGVLVGPLVEGGSVRITAFRVLDNPRLLVAVSLSADDISDAFRHDALVRLAALALMGLGVFFGGRGLVREAAARARSERAIALSERQLTDALRIAEMATLRFAGPALLAPVSDRARSFFAWPASRTLVSADELAAPVSDVDADAWRREIRACLAGRRRFELDLRFGDLHNPARVVHVEGSWEDGGADMADGVMAVFRDVTRERRAESRLRHVERLEAVGRLTGGVAHDFNNMLTVILGNVDRLADEPQPDVATTREAIAEIGRAADRAAELTSQLLAFARRQPLNPRRIDVNELVRAAAGMIERVLGRQIELRLALAPAPCRALVDPGQIETALINLCANARDAMPSGGVLTIATSLVELDAEDVRDQPDAVPGRHVALSVSDTGVGIPAERLSFIFEPFYSTKEIGRGTGLGLAMVYGFVRQSGGHVRVHSEVGRGTIIHLYLPEASAAPAAEALRSDGPADAARGAGETILLVEDEDMVRESLSRQLADLGYAVIVAADSAAALSALSSPRRIDLMLTDLVLASGLNGRELAARAALVRPGLPVVFMSGYSEQVVAPEGRLEPGVRLLCKPFRKQELGDMLRRTLRPARQPAEVAG